MRATQCPWFLSPGTPLKYVSTVSQHLVESPQMLEVALSDWKHHTTMSSKRSSNT